MNRGRRGVKPARAKRHAELRLSGEEASTATQSRFPLGAGPAREHDKGDEEGAWEEDGVGRTTTGNSPTRRGPEKIAA